MANQTKWDNTFKWHRFNLKRILCAGPGYRKIEQNEAVTLFPRANGLDMKTCSQDFWPTNGDAALATRVDLSMILYLTTLA